MSDALLPLAVALLLVPACSSDDSEPPCETDCFANESEEALTDPGPGPVGSESDDPNTEGGDGSESTAGSTTTSSGSDAGPSTGGAADPVAAACAALCVQQTSLGCGGAGCEESCAGFYSVPQCPAESIAYIECLTAAMTCEIVDTEPMCTAAREALAACAG